MNVWGIIGVICLFGLITAFSLAKEETYKENRRKTFLYGFLTGGLGCAMMLGELFAGILSLYALYLFFSWIFG